MWRCLQKQQIQRPLVCLDQKRAGNVLTPRAPGPKPGERQPARRDYAVWTLRACNLFMLARAVLNDAMSLTPHHIDFAWVIKTLVDEVITEARHIVLVMDQHHSANQLPMGRLIRWSTPVDRSSRSTTRQARQLADMAGSKG